MPRTNHAAPIAGAYFLHFATVGVLLPFLPAYFREIAFDAGDIGALLAIAPAVMLIAPPFWGRLADRTGRGDLVLVALTCGALVGLVPLLYAPSVAAAALTLTAHAAFATGIGTMIDSLALAHVAGHGGTFARLRLFGSLGFVVASTTVGLSFDRVDRTAIACALVLLAASCVWSFVVVRSHAAARALSSTSTRVGTAMRPTRLLSQAPIALLCAASALHWIAGAPFHGCFALHAGALGHAPWVVGVSVGLGVAAEVVVMALYPRFASRLSPRVTLAAAFSVTVLRWAGMAYAESTSALVALTLLHGFTFGAFYAAAVDYLARVVPIELRATGQSVFAAVTFGLGGLVGYALAGQGFEALGGHHLFGIAAFVEVLAIAVVWRLPSEPAKKH